MKYFLTSIIRDYPLFLGVLGYIAVDYHFIRKPMFKRYDDYIHYVRNCEAQILNDKRR
jgi:hypothetical protein